MKKRSTAISLTLMATGAVTLTGCGDDEVPGHVYQTVEQCIAERVYAEPECHEAFNSAETVHADAAPRFEDRQDCEAEFGPGHCGVGNYSTGGSGLFVPMMTGFLIARALDNRPGPMPPMSQPLYQRPEERGSSGGGYYGSRWNYTTARGDSVGNRTGATTIAASTATPPRSGTFVKSGGSLSRGGFGSFGGSRSSGG